MESGLSHMHECSWVTVQKAAPVCRLDRISQWNTPRCLIGSDSTLLSLLSLLTDRPSWLWSLRVAQAAGLSRAADMCGIGPSSQPNALIHLTCKHSSYLIVPGNCTGIILLKHGYIWSSSRNEMHRKTPLRLKLAWLSFPLRCLKIEIRLGLTNMYGLLITEVINYAESFSPTVMTVFASSNCAF